VQVTVLEIVKKPLAGPTEEFGKSVSRMVLKSPPTHGGGGKSHKKKRFLEKVHLGGKVVKGSHEMPGLSYNKCVRSCGGRKR